MSDTNTEALKLALEADAEFLHKIGGCSDGGCIIERPKGMHTNGGCRCYKDHRKMQHLAHAHQKLIKAVTSALSPPTASVNVQESERERLKEIHDAALNLLKQKGRHNTEVAYKRLEDAFRSPRNGKLPVGVQESAALPPAVQVPPGWKLVPIEPTAQMVSEGFESIRMEENWPALMDRVYKAMIAAAPSPSSKNGDSK